MNILRILAALLLVASTFSIVSINTYAQDQQEKQSGNDMSGETDQIDRLTGQLRDKSSPGLAERIQILGARATEKLNYIQNEVVNYFSGWSLYWAQLLSAIVSLFGFLKLMREQEGKAEFNIWAWFVRLGVFISLIAASPALLTDLKAIGDDVATGQSGNGVMFRFYDKNLGNFEESYAKFAKNQFKVRIPEGSTEFPVVPPDGIDKFLGMLKDQAGTVRDFNNNLTDSTYTLPLLYGWLGACRTILELANFVLVVLAGILLMAFRIIAPFMMVLAIDRQLAQRMTYPFVWGVIVLTLIWPPVSYFIRGFAYLIGNVAMALGDTDPVYTWNEATMQAFRLGSSDPFYTVLFSCFVMTIVALCLFISPFIAYQISMGRVYEGISTAVSQFAGSIIGAGVELYSSTAGALVNRETGQMQASAGYEAETKRASAERVAADLGVRGRQTGAEAGIKAGKREKLGELNARATQQINSLNLTRQQQNDLADGGQFNVQLNDFALQGREGMDNLANFRQQQGGILAGLFPGLFGGASSGISSAAYASRSAGAAGATAGAAGAAGATAGAAGATAGAAGYLRTVAPAVGMGLLTGGAQVVGTIFGASDQVKANNQALSDRGGNLDRYHEQIRQNSKNYLNGVGDVKGVFEINQEFADGMSEQTRLYTSRTEEAINAGAAIQMKGISDEANMGLEANRVRFEAQIEASGITRDASFKAADMHMEEALIRAAGSVISHEIKNALSQKY
jgi:hypothetical protein